MTFPKDDIPIPAILVTIILTLLLSIDVTGQVRFESGYYIDNSNNRIICEIRNEDWRYNPRSFELISDIGVVSIVHIEDVKEFGLDHGPKYIRYTVGLDQSSQNLSRLTNFRNPEFTMETVFLKVIITGKASLYSYEKANKKLFFFSLNNDSPKQLIYKQYLDANKNVRHNVAFRQQLKNNLICKKEATADLDFIDYKLNDLVMSFKKYLDCENSLYEIAADVGRRIVTRIVLKPGFSISSITSDRETPQAGLSSFGDVDFGNRGNVRLGIEAEFILPFNKNKWALFLEPFYQSYSSKSVISFIDRDAPLHLFEEPGQLEYFWCTSIKLCAK